jgi:hypothetical protein
MAHFGPAKVTAARDHAIAVRNLISPKLAIVLAIITVSVAALAYEWRHAESLRTHQRSVVEQFQKR